MILKTYFKIEWILFYILKRKLPVIWRTLRKNKNYGEAILVNN